MTFRGKDITPPDGIRTDVFTIRPVRASDNPLDYEAVMASKQSLRLWEQATWPEDDFTLEDNLEDLVTMEDRHNIGYAFGYTVVNPAETECLGCIYIMPPEAKMYIGAQVMPIGKADWSTIEATVFFWARESRIAEGMDRQILDAIRPWLAHEWAFGPHVIVVSEPFRQQVAMIEATDLKVQFEIQLADGTEKHLAYA